MANENVRDAKDLVDKKDKGIGLTTIASGVIGILFLIFVFQNSQSGNLDFLWFDFDLPVWVLTVVVFAGGVIFGYSAKIGRDRRKRRNR